jgi:hypothetical protein
MMLDEPLRGLEFQLHLHGCTWVRIPPSPPYKETRPALRGPRLFDEGGVRTHVRSWVRQNRRERFWTELAGPQGASHGWTRAIPPSPPYEERRPALRGPCLFDEGGVRTHVRSGSDKIAGSDFGPRELARTRAGQGWHRRTNSFGNEFGQRELARTRAGQGWHRRNPTLAASQQDGPATAGPFLRG